MGAMAENYLAYTWPILGLSPRVNNSLPLAFQLRSNEVLNLTCGMRTTMLMGLEPFIESPIPSSDSPSRPQCNRQSLLALLGFSDESPTDHEERPHWLRITIVTLLLISGLLVGLLIAGYLLGIVFSSSLQTRLIPVKPLFG